jgi:ribose/xylose/arabinose/galactoside ABC-type transport system permease subunit
VLGVLILGMTAKGLRLMGLNTNIQLIVTGTVMVLAVLMHTFRDRLSMFGK